MKVVNWWGEVFDGELGTLTLSVVYGGLFIDEVEKAFKFTLRSKSETPISARLAARAHHRRYDKKADMYYDQHDDHVLWLGPIGPNGKSEKHLNLTHLQRSRVLKDDTGNYVEFSIGGGAMEYFPLRTLVLTELRIYTGPRFETLDEPTLLYHVNMKSPNVFVPVFVFLLVVVIGILILFF